MVHQSVGATWKYVVGATVKNVSGGATVKYAGEGDLVAFTTATAPGSLPTKPGSWVTAGTMVSVISTFADGPP